jgi:hypothetical protein
VSHIEPKKRITVLGYERNTTTEEAIRERLTACTEYYNEYIEQLKSK